MSAFVAAVHSGASLYREGDALFLGICYQTLEGKPQRVHVHTGENSHTYSDGNQPGPRAARGLRHACLQNRAGNPDFVHQRRPGVEPGRGQWNG